MTLIKKKEKTEKKKSGKNYATGFTLLIIPNSSDEAKTTEISYDTLVKYFAAFIAAMIIIVGLIASMMVHNYRLKESIAFQEDCVAQLSETNEELNATIEGLNKQISADREAFSKIEDTISQKEEEAQEEKEKAALPSIVPIKGKSALAVEDPFADNEQARSFGLVFSTLGGAVIIATGDGVIEDVQQIEADEGYNCFVMIDHGNGYKSFYRFLGDVSVKKGDSLMREDVVGIQKEDGFVSYEISENGKFVDPAVYISQTVK